MARYEKPMLASFTRNGRLPMTKAGARLQVHPASVDNAASRFEAVGPVARPELTPAGMQAVVRALQQLRPDADDFAP